MAPHFSLLLTMTPPPSEWFLLSAMAAAATASSSQRRAHSAPARETGSYVTKERGMTGRRGAAHAGSCSPPAARRPP